jgi:hypothetical protein
MTGCSKVHQHVNHDAKFVNHIHQSYSHHEHNKVK